MLAIFAGLFFLAWFVAFLFAVRNTFFPDHHRDEPAGNQASMVLPDSSRGRYPVVDRGGRDLAVSFPAKSVYARPLEVEHPDAVALFLSRELGVPEQELKRELKEERSFCWLGHQLSGAAVSTIQAHKLPGIYVVDEIKRFYPQGDAAAQLIGFAREGHGLTGIEAQFDQQLQTTVDIPDEAGPPRGPLVLTLDLRIQELMAGELAQLVAETGATGGEGIVMDPRSGEVLGLANQPGYDANFLGDYDENSQKNRVLSLSLPAPGFRALFRLAAASQPPPVLTGLELGSEKPVVAKKEPLKGSAKNSKKNSKKGGGQVAAAPKPMRLAQFDGGYRSRSLAALEKLSEPADFPAFLARLGFGHKTLFDLPVVATENAAVGGKPPTFRATGAELITAMASMINQEGLVVPRVVSGVLNPQTGMLQPLPREQSAPSPDSTQQVRDFLNRLASELTSTIYLEELSEGPEPVAELAEPPAPLAKETPEKAAPVTLGNTGIWGTSVARPAPTVDRVTTKIGPEAKVVETGEIKKEPTRNYVSVLLAMPAGGVTPDGDERPQEVIVLLALEGAKLDPAAPSPLRASVDKIMPQLRAWAAEDSTPLSKVPWVANEPLWQNQWQKALAERDAQNRGNAKHNRRRMPDLAGSSLRRALQILNPYGLKIRIHGVGRVVEQRPAPGEAITGGDCLLTLSGMNLIDRPPDRQLAVGLESGTDKLQIVPLASPQANVTPGKKP